MTTTVFAASSSPSTQKESKRGARNRRRHQVLLRPPKHLRRARAAAVDHLRPRRLFTRVKGERAVLMDISTLLLSLFLAVEH